MKNRLKKHCWGDKVGLIANIKLWLMRRRFLKSLERFFSCPGPVCTAHSIGFSRHSFALDLIQNKCVLPFRYSYKELTEIISKEYNFEEKILYFADKTAQL